MFAALVALTSRQGIVEDDAMGVEWVELPPSARTLVKPRPIEGAAKAPDNSGTLPMPAKTIVPVLPSTNTQEPPPLETDILQSLGVGEVETPERGDTETLLPDSSTERRLDRGSYTRFAREREARDPIIEDTYREKKEDTSPRFRFGTCSR